MSREEEASRILVVDDSPATIEVMRRYLACAGYPVYSAAGVAEAINLLERTPIDLVITDLKMPKASGLDLIHHVHENFRQTQTLMVTGYPSIASAVEAVKGGAEDYLAKPFTEAELLDAVGRALANLRTRQAANEKAAAPFSSPSGMIGRSEAILAIFELIRKAAQSSATVLITGESGTGKELVARDIHYSSARAAAPFVPVNCGGIPETLLESELFGHVKGAFTGATETRAGFFQTADGGTIFLDEISETTPAMQVKLLRALNDRDIYMVGSTRAQKVDVRIAAATNKDLAHLVRRGEFREDLFFRLNVIPVRVPPLRERGDDIALLIRHFAAEYGAELGRTPPAFSDSALASLRRYPWPGNVRELQNVVQRLVVMSESDIIEVSDLPELMRFSALRGSGLHRTLAEVEAEHIQQVLQSVSGNKTRAASILGIDRKTLREKLRNIGADLTQADTEAG
jgi:DNA-binding NtrC family response regulator